MYTGDTEKAVLLSHLLDLSRKMEGTLFGVLLRTSHAKLPEALLHQVRIVIVKFGFELGGAVPSLPYLNAAPYIIEEALSFAVSLLQRVLASYHFGHTAQLLNIFCLYPARMELSRHMGSKSSLHGLNLSLLTYWKERKYVFQSRWSSHCRSITLTKDWTPFVQGGQ